MAGDKAKRRRRCSGPCGELYEPAELQKVAGRESLCAACLLEAANAIAPLTEKGAVRAAEERLVAELEATREQWDVPHGMDSRILTREQPLTPNDNDVRVEVSDGNLRITSHGQGGGGGRLLPAPATQLLVPEPRIEGDTPEEEEQRFVRLPSVEVEGWPLRYGRLSASALACFARCPEQFRREYVHGEKRPQSPQATIGSAIHRTLDVMWRFKMAQGEDLPVDLALGLLVDVTRTLGGQYEAKRILDWGAEGSDAWLLRARRMLEAYATEAAPGVEPVASEEVFIKRIAGVPVPLCGYLDVRTNRAMVDTKFGAKRARTITPDWRIQALLYLQAFDLPMEYHSVNHAGDVATPAVEPGLRLERTSASFMVGAELVRRYTAAILAYADTFGVHGTWPGNITHTWACGSCAFRDTTCAWWNPPREQMEVL